MPYKDPEQMRAYQREWKARRRREWLAENGPCVRCESTEDMQVDHIDPTKKVSHKVWTWAAHRREAELAKCQVLCRLCHEAKTNSDGRRRLTDGDVALMRRIYSEGTASYRDLAARFGVHHTHVGDVIRGRYH